jgi:hypothetical protein
MVDDALRDAHARVFEYFAQWFGDATRIEAAGSYFVQERREQEVIGAVDDRKLDIATRSRGFKRLRDIHAAESGAEDEDAGLDHGIILSYAREPAFGSKIRQMYRDIEHGGACKRHSSGQKLGVRMMALRNKVARAYVQEETGEESQDYGKALLRQPEKER